MSALTLDAKNCPRPQPQISIAIGRDLHAAIVTQLVAEFVAQSYNNFEILLGSAGPADWAQLKDTSQDSRIRGVQLPLDSPAQQASVLAQAAQGIYVFFPNPVARYGPTFLQEIVDFLKLTERDFDVLYAPVNQLDNSNFWTANSAWDQQYKNRPEFIHLLTCDHSLPLSPIVIRKNSFDRYGAFLPSYVHRYTQEYALRVLVQSGAIRAFACQTVDRRHDAQEHARATAALDTFAEKITLYTHYAHKHYLSYFHGYEGHIAQLLEHERQSLLNMLGSPISLELALHYAELRANMIGYRDYHDAPLYKGQPSISVILITQGQCLNKLARALESLQAQSEQHFEIICIQTVGPSLHEWLKPYQGRFRLTYIRCPKPLPRTTVRKMAIECAAGKYVAYLDEQAAFHPMHLETLGQRIEKAGVDFVISNGNIAIEQQETNGSYTTLDTWIGAYTTRFDQMNLIICPSVSLSTVMHRATLLREYGMLDIDLEILDDWFYLLTLMSGRNSQALVKENTVTIYEELSFKHSKLESSGLTQFIREYDLTCLHLQTFGKHDTERRHHYRRTLEELDTHWATTIQTQEGLRYALQTLIGRR